MSAAGPSNGDPRPNQWAPHDYTDGRALLDWKTSYPPEARKLITLEAWYIFAFFGFYLVLLFIMLFVSLNYSGQRGHLPFPETILKYCSKGCYEYLGYCLAWVAGSIGGCLFGIKWMYHSVAKRIWHEDRRLWRLLTPHVSGAVSLFMLFIVASGLLKIFDTDIVNRHKEVLAFSFLVGYFSDKALAKMAEIADTLFGATSTDGKMVKR